MEDYLHDANIGWHLTMELAQSYLKGYVVTWWKTVKQEKGKNHGYTWEFFKERVKFEFIPTNFDYISRRKIRDLVNATNDNLRQYVKAYFELMLEIRHMHEMDRVYQFVMGLQLGLSVSLRRIGLPHYSRPSWKWKVSRMWDGVKNPGSRRRTNFFIRSRAMRENGI